MEQVSICPKNNRLRKRHENSIKSSDEQNEKQSVSMLIIQGRVLYLLTA